MTPVDAILAIDCSRCHIRRMTDKPKRPRDANQLAKFIVDVATGDDPEVPKNENAPSMAERGRKGGKVGGAVRASRMTPEERSQASSQAARARWSRDR